MADKKAIANRGFFSVYKFPLTLISILVMLLYMRTTQFKFVGLDDNLLIQGNYKFIKDVGNIKEAFVHDAFYNPSAPGASSGYYYRPLLIVSLILDAQFGRQSPNFYHFTNILIHLVCCMLLFRFLIAFDYAPVLATLGGIVLAVHPMLSQAVGWIPGRNDSLLTLFILTSLIYFKQFIDSGIKSRLYLHILFFTLALFTKETAIFLPLISLLYYFIIFQSGSSWKHKIQTKPIQWLLSGYLGVGLFWFFLRKNVVSNTHADLSFTHLSQSFIDNFPIYPQLIQKMIFPYNLSIMSVAQDTEFLLSFILIGLICALLLISKHKRWNYILWGFIWFNAFLLPGFLVPILTGFEHRIYLPLVGFLLMVFEIDYVKNINFKKPWQIGPAFILLSIFILLNIKHTEAFSNGLSFWEKASTNAPHSALAKLNYGVALAERGQPEEAIKVYKQGLEINSAEPMLHNNIGIIYARREQYPAAQKEFLEELKVNPGYADGYYNLGMVYQKLGNEAQMKSALEKAITINPDHQLAKNALSKYTNYQ
jgi:hypothetical protein